MANRRQSGISRRAILKSGAATAALIGGSRLGLAAAQDATPAAGSTFTSADYQPSAPVEIEYWQYVLDAKVNPTICAEWLAEAFRAG